MRQSLATLSGLLIAIAILIAVSLVVEAAFHAGFDNAKSLYAAQNECHQ